MSSIADDSPHWHKVVAGAAAGGGSRLFTAPFDLLRIRRQLYPASTPSNMLESFSTIAKTEGGIPSLFRGNVAATHLWMGYSAIQFYCYDVISHVLLSSSLTSESASLSNVAFVSGAMAGVCATVATYPLDLCRTTFAAQGLQSSSSSRDACWKPPRSIWEFALVLYRLEGLQGFFMGIGPAVVQIIPYMGLNFMLYESLLMSRHEESTTVGHAGMAGALSGGVSKMAVFPLDTVKKRMQVQAVSGTKIYHHMMHCLTTIARTEGVRALYNGMVPSIAKNMIGTGLSFAIFTLAMKSLA